MAHSSLTKAFLQAAVTASMHCQAERCIQLCHNKGSGHIFEGGHIFERLPENYTDSQLHS